MNNNIIKYTGVDMEVSISLTMVTLSTLAQGTAGAVIHSEAAVKSCPDK